MKKLSSKQLAQIAAFSELLERWGNTHNLMSKSQLKKACSHINESIEVAAYLGEFFVDLGSGAGFPGIPAGIAYPEKKIVLIEASEKKSIFLHHSLASLGLKNIEVINSRVEDLKQPIFNEPFEIVTRAFGSVKDTIRSTKHLLSAPGNSLKLIKTESQMKEEALPKNYIIKKIDKICLKEKEKQHILVTIEAEE